MNVKTSKVLNLLRIYRHIIVCTHLFSSVRISFYENLLYLPEFLFYENFFEFLFICENQFFFLRSLWKWASVSMHYLKHIFYHRNTIMIFCRFRMFQVYVFCVEFFSFCVSLLFWLNKVSLNSLNSVAILTPFAVLDYLLSIFFIEYIFDFNPTNSSIIFRSCTSFILSITFY